MTLIAGEQKRFKPGRAVTEERAHGEIAGDDELGLRVVKRPPGTRERLSKAGDVERFAPQRPQRNLDFDAPLLGGRA